MANTKEKFNVIYQAIKILESLILVIIGIIICIFSGNQNLQNAISYCVAIIALVFGLLTIAFSYLFSKGIGSIDTISGTFMISLSILIIVNPNIVTDFIPLFFGILLIVYAVIFLIETFNIGLNLKINKGATLKFFGYLILSILLLVGGILVVCFLERVSQIINILIGTILIIVGICLFILTITSLRKSQTKSTALVKTKSKKKVKSNVIDVSTETKSKENDVKLIDKK